LAPFHQFGGTIDMILQNTSSQGNKGRERELFSHDLISAAITAIRENGTCHDDMAFCSQTRPQPQKDDIPNVEGSATRR
jgi:hypothetical protein